jgi:hypothetical protein
MYFILTRHGCKNVRENPCNKASTVVYKKSSMIFWYPMKKAQLAYAQLAWSHGQGGATRDGTQSRDSQSPSTLPRSLPPAASIDRRYADLD